MTKKMKRSTKLAIAIGLGIVVLGAVAFIASSNSTPAAAVPAYNCFGCQAGPSLFSGGPDLTSYEPSRYSVDHPTMRRS